MQTPFVTKQDIGHMRYAVEVCPENSLGDGKEAGEYSSRGTIKVEQADPRTMLASLLHEDGHAFFEHSGLRMIKELEPYEETLCNLFAYGFLDVLARNPDLRRFINHVFGEP